MTFLIMGKGANDYDKNKVFGEIQTHLHRVNLWDVQFSKRFDLQNGFFLFL